MKIFKHLKILLKPVVNVVYVLSSKCNVVMKIMFTINLSCFKKNHSNFKNFNCFPKICLRAYEFRRDFLPYFR